MAALNQIATCNAWKVYNYSPPYFIIVYRLKIMNWNIQNLSRIDWLLHGVAKKFMFIIFQFLKFSLMVSLHVAYQYTAHDKMHTILKIGNTKEKNMKQSAVQKQPMGAFWFIFSTFFLKLIFYIRVISL